MRFEDLTGQRFNDLTVLRRDTSSKKTKWVCRCELCGREVSVFAYNLKNGNSKNCGCAKGKALSERSRKDLTGQTFGFAEVISPAGVNKSKQQIFNCRCKKCGRSFTVLGTNLVTGKQVSCGCVRDANIRKGRADVQDEAHALHTNVGRIRSKKVSKANRTTGVTGVCYIKSTGLYTAYIGWQGKQYLLKASTSLEDCIKARKAAEKEVYGNFLEWYDKYIKPPKPDKK